ncbi:uncharacterized protein [Cherax quadricarinatus]|uniref:uncharacterized protein isoform X2 n=1 Tax=Cherax quadricarinatus TaxID=27406 RepID=UPI00387E48A1
MCSIRGLLVLTACVLGVTTAVYVDQGCVVRSKYETQWVWSDTQVSGWVFSNRSQTIFTLLVQLGDEGYPRNYDNITLTTRNVELVRVKDFVKSTKIIPVPKILSDGWQEFVFKVTSMYEIYSASLNISLPVYFTSNLPIKSIEFTGSNLTFNCIKKMRVWEVDIQPVIIPLDSSQQHWLSIYAVGEVSPSLTLGERKIRLGWENNGLTTLGGPSSPLPAFTQHYITLSCRADNGVYCVIKLGETGSSQEILKQRQFPRSLLVERLSGDKFFLLLHQEDPLSASFQNATSCPGLCDPSQVHTGAAAASTAAVILAVLLAVALMAIFIVYRNRLWKTSGAARERDMENAEEKAPLVEKNNGNDISSRDNTRVVDHSERSRLYSAVVEGNASKVQQLLDDGAELIDLNTYVEAHILGSQQVVDVMSSRRLPSISREELITLVLEEYERRVEEVMDVAKLGLCRGASGVEALLHRYQLPATVRDQQGCSILHYIASSKDDNKQPLWAADDVIYFLNNYKCLLNARDYAGCTCLHLLAKAASSSDLKIIWGKREVGVSDAWVEMAELLVTQGADPTFVDNKGHLPQYIAKKMGNIKLLIYLAEVCNHCENNKVEQKFDDLVKAARTSKLERLMSLLNKNTPLLPMGATCDPLVEAIKYSSLGSVQLLLSAGAPLCGLSLISITALEASHGRSRLPAIFPAIMRKEYASKLCWEAMKIHERENTDLCKAVKRLAAEVRKNGPKFSWEFIDEKQNGNGAKMRSKRARSFLCTAASLGMSLTCQMLGLEDFHLHPLPSENHPVELSLERQQFETLYTLLRDLHMPLVSLMKNEDLPQTLCQEVELAELEQLKVLLKRYTNNNKFSDLMKQVEAAYRGQEVTLENTILIAISRLGLVSLFFKLSNKINDVNVNSIVDELTGTKMLHVAALYGRLGMIEYLLYNGADIQAEDKRGLTAAHLAAVKGNKECLEYLHDYMTKKGIRSKIPSDKHPTAEQLLSGYENYVKDFNLVLLPEEYRQEILSEPLFATKARLVLKKKESELKISDLESLRKYACKWNMEKGESRMHMLQEEIGRFLQEVGKANSLFNGFFFTSSQKAKKTCKPVDSLDVYLEVNSGQFGDYKIEHNYADPCIVTLISLNSQKSSGASFLNDEFEKTVRQTLETYVFELSTIWLIYPWLTVTDIGLSIYLVWHYKEKTASHDQERTALLKINIVPVIKLDYQKDNYEITLPPFLNGCITPHIPVHLASSRKGTWTYVLTQMENWIYSQLPERKKTVYVACNVLCKMLRNCWWFPVQHSRRHGRAWHCYSLGIKTVSDRLLRSLFLEELRDSQEVDWEPSKFLDRMISTFKRATFLNIDGKLQPKKQLRLILDPLHSSQDANFIVTAVVDYLEKLKCQFEEY